MQDDVRRRLNLDVKELGPGAMPKGDVLFLGWRNALQHDDSLISEHDERRFGVDVQARDVLVSTVVTLTSEDLM